MGWRLLLRTEQCHRWERRREKGDHSRGARIAGKAVPLARSGGGRFIRSSYPMRGWDAANVSQSIRIKRRNGAPGCLEAAAGAINAFQIEPDMLLVFAFCCSMTKHSATRRTWFVQAINHGLRRNTASRETAGRTTCAPGLLTILLTYMRVAA